MMKPGRNRKYEWSNHNQKSKKCNQNPFSKRKPRTRWLHGLMFKEETTSILSKLFQKFAEKGMTPNSFYKVTITVIPKPVKDTTDK